MGILLINGGEIGGNTTHLGHAFLEGRDFTQIDLASLKVYDYGTYFADDQFDEVLEAMKAADTIVIGSPVYWHDMSGMTRCLLDRCYGPVSSDDLAGKRLFFLLGRRAHAADVRARRIHHQPLRRPVRHGLHGYGPQCKRSARTRRQAVITCPRFRNLPADYRTQQQTLAQARSESTSRPHRSYRTE